MCFLIGMIVTDEPLESAWRNTTETVLHLKLLSNRGVNVYPNGFEETFCTDHWRARYMGENNQATHGQIISLLDRLGREGLDIIKTENLYTFDGVKGYVAEGE